VPSSKSVVVYDSPSSESEEEEFTDSGDEEWMAEAVRRINDESLQKKTAAAKTRSRNSAPQEETTDENMESEDENAISAAPTPAAIAALAPKPSAVSSNPANHGVKVIDHGTGGKVWDFSGQSEKETPTKIIRAKKAGDKMFLSNDMFCWREFRDVPNSKGEIVTHENFMLGRDYMSMGASKTYSINMPRTVLEKLVIASKFLFAQSDQYHAKKQAKIDAGETGE